jgi:hypothetical protein
MWKTETDSSKTRKIKEQGTEKKRTNGLTAVLIRRAECAFCYTLLDE